MTKRTRKLLINIAVLVALTGITITILVISYRDEFNFENIMDFLSSGNVWWIVAAFGCMLCFILFEGLAIHVIARRLGHKSKFASSMAYSSSDVYYSAITPSASGGQPASLYYMMHDGMNAGTAGFTLMFNLVAYTAAVIVMGVFAFIARPGIFSAIDMSFAKTLIILGFCLQGLLLGFFIMCLIWSKAILKIGNGGIKLLTKMRIVKKPDKWRAKWSDTVEKYRAGRDIIKAHPALFFEALGLNIVQRVSQTFIPCFVCMAVSDNASVIDLFCMQVYVLLGYNCIPLPGGTGAYEYLYIQTYAQVFESSFVMSAMMVSRFISYYICLIVSGLYTLVYHTLGIRSGKIKSDDEEKPKPDETPPEGAAAKENADTNGVAEAADKISGTELTHNASEQTKDESEELSKLAAETGENDGK